MNRNPLWFLLNLYGWLIFIMSVITAFIIGEWWIVFLGVIGYQTVLLVEMTWGGNLGRTGRVRLARAEQENRELRAEQARLLGAIRERDEKLAPQGEPPFSPTPAQEPGLPDPGGSAEPEEK
jgi:hypothetical protein